jgi:hypothetical protein
MSSTAPMVSDFCPHLTRASLLERGECNLCRKGTLKRLAKLPLDSTGEDAYVERILPREVAVICEEVRSSREWQ